YKARVVGLSSYPIFEDNEFQGRLILGTELTKQNQIEQQLHQAQKLESVGQLAAGVAHEINTPMQYVGDNLQYVDTKFKKYTDYIDIVEELIVSADEAEFNPDIVAKIREFYKKQKMEKLTTQIPEALSDSIDGVGHVSRIVRAMKELSHPGGDEKSAVDINKSLETTVTVSTNEWKYVAEVEMDFEPELQMVQGLPGELKQVFLNLIVNAAHAISDVTDGGNEGRGKIFISTRSMEDYALIEIKDTGGGIPETVRKRVFDPFFTTKGIGKGTGQGLAIAHSVIVQMHGGQISFDVEEGVGTTFKLEIPFKAQEAEGSK
ncbi:MAG: ATP-binding protein, partial [Planctomycetota bacterium]